MENQENKTLLDTGAALANIRQMPQGKPFVVVPDDFNVRDIENYLPNPIRKRGNVQITDTPSFIFFTKKHGSLDDCTIYADIDAEKSRFALVAVINDHGADKAQWQDFRASLAPKLSLEWNRWLSKNKLPMSQADFATWLEDNLPDIANVDGFPSGADVLAMALGFEANAEKRLRSKINLQNGGVQFEFVEDEDKDTRTRMQVFQRFTLGIPVFDGSNDAYPLEARLKYREKDGKVTFWFELVRPDRVFKTAVTNELNRIKEETGFPVVAGKVD